VHQTVDRHAEPTVGTKRAKGEKSREERLGSGKNRKSALIGDESCGYGGRKKGGGKEEFWGQLDKGTEWGAPRFYWRTPIKRGVDRGTKRRKSW